MIHLDKYTCAVEDGLVFQGNPTPMRGTWFTCKECNARAFKIKGDKDHLDGEVKTSFSKKLKAYHNDHKKTCGRTAETANETAVERLVESHEEEEAVYELQPEEIAAWSSWDVSQYIGNLKKLPATLKSFEVYEPMRDRIVCRGVFTNEHGSVQLDHLSLFMLCEVADLRDAMLSAKAEYMEGKVTAVRKAVVNKCVTQAIKAVLALSKERHFRSARGKLRRTLEAMHQKPPVPSRPVSPVKKFQSRLTYRQAGHVKPPVTLSKPTAVFDLTFGEIERSHDLEALLPYLNSKLLEVDDIEALLSLCQDHAEIQSKPSTMLTELVRIHAASFMQEKVSYLIKPLALRRWLQHAWSIADATGGAEVHLATAMTYPADITTNEGGFKTHPASVPLTQLGHGLACAVLGDKACGAVESWRVLPLGLAKM